MIDYKRNAAADYAKRTIDSIEYMFEYITENRDNFTDEELSKLESVKHSIETLSEFAETTETKPLDGIELTDYNQEIIVSLDTGIVERLEQIAKSSLRKPYDINDYAKWVLIAHAVGNEVMLGIHYDLYKNPKSQ